MRVSSHRLQIEAGRWAKPTRIPVNERKCLICNSLEDEYHFVLECSIYVNLRKTYIPRKFWNRPNMFKFLELLNTNDRNVLRNLGIFVEKAFDVRKTKI